ncbi:MAG: large subunit ribosomal protein L17 [Parcubacteria group bacterium Licking1014_17]|nr:MAG: large subunit ribosomal protein L17 [Parcubacteria group bacterium Licking1014_17]
MNKKSKLRKFGRVKKQRGALLKELANSLVKHGRIKTTSAKAKSLKPFVERLITRGSSNTPPAVRYLRNHVGEEAVKKIVSDLGPKHAPRKGGCLRITPLAQRVSDGAAMSIIEFVK